MASTNNIKTMQKLLKLMLDGEALSTEQMGKVLGLTKEELDAQLKELTDKGILLGWRPVINADVQRSKVHAAIELRIAPEREDGYDKLAQRVSKFDEVDSCYLMSGAYDLLLFVKADSLRDVIAFPKIKDASCLMTDAPTPVDPQQLAVLHLLPSETSDQTDGKNGKQKKAKPSINVENVAFLARLALTEDEKKSMPDELSSIISFADQLSELDLNNIKASEHITGETNVLREDIPSNRFTKKELP